MHVSVCVSLQVVFVVAKCASFANNSTIAKQMNEIGIYDSSVRAVITCIFQGTLFKHGGIK